MDMHTCMHIYSAGTQILLVATADCTCLLCTELFFFPPPLLPPPSPLVPPFLWLMAGKLLPLHMHSDELRTQMLYTGVR